VKTEPRKDEEAADPAAKYPAGIRQLYRYFGKATGGLIILPLVVLFLLYFFDEFDTQAFGILAPEIQRAFHLSDTGFGTIFIFNTSIVLLISVPLGHYADRLPRRLFVVFGALIAGLFSFLTGLIGIVVALLFFVRLGNGVGLTINTSVHPSLLADYYNPEDWTSVYSIHLNAPRLGAIIGPILAGVVGQLLGWRAAFLILPIPVAVMAFVALRLHEPLRGGTQDRAAAEMVAQEKPAPFDRSVRTVMSIKTLNRQYIAWIFVGAGFIPLAFVVPLLLKHRFHVQPFWRGVIIGAGAAAAFVGVRYSRNLTQRWFTQGMGQPLNYTGWVLVLVGVGIFAIAVSPTLWLCVFFILATNLIGGVFWVPFTVTETFVSPARVRTLALSLGSGFLIAGVWLLYLLPGFLQIADHHGEGWGLVAVVPYWFIGGFVLRSARHYVEKDAVRALEMLQTAARIREERLNRTTDEMLICSKVNVAYDSTQVLFGVDFTVREGELVALLGTNGAGKSTLLKTISGLVHPIGGSIFFDGEDITFHDPEETAELGIIQMPGGKSVFPSLTVQENIDMAGWLYTKDQAHIRSATDHVFDLFPVLKQRLNQQAGSLSGGEQQMLSLGQALISKPRLLMIDELSLGLAPVVVQQLLQIVTDIHAAGATIILVEQSVNVALTVAKHAYFMEKGQIRFDGPTSELLGRADILRSVFLEGAQAVVSSGNGAPKKGRARR
jgi:branched-chain amino acid transport system ATP-binding protein